MSEAKHTPGPWWIFPEDQIKHHVRGPVKGCGGVYADISVCSFTLRSNQEVEANAKLIAAAPDLLEACKRVMQLQTSAGGDEVFEQVKAAIAKAEGR